MSKSTHYFQQSTVRLRMMISYVKKKDAYFYKNLRIKILFLWEMMRKNYPV